MSHEQFTRQSADSILVIITSGTMKATTLVILAAGMGTRFGGLKQLEPVTAEDETILDFSLFDARRCGVKKVVFVIRNEIEAKIRNAFEDKLKNFDAVSYVIQEEKGPVREGPWGTGHAVLAAKPAVEDNFLVINADDFYGKDAFDLMTSYETSPVSTNFALAGYELGMTLSDHGAVSRGECVVGDDGFLLRLIERKGILRDNGSIHSNGDRRISPSTKVSMNLWAFTPGVFGLLETRFANFAKTARATDEFYLNEALSDAVTRKEATIRVLETKSEWMGVTYRGDIGRVSARLRELKAEGAYPEQLW